jgi:ATP-dependent Lhr-like helicase
VSTEQFARLLRQIGSAEIALIEQSPDGHLLLGPLGEKLVEHYSFYAVFQTSEDYRVLLGSKQIGVLPTDRVFVPEMTIILSGRRWRIIAVHSRDKVIEVTQDRAGTPPPFGGSGGLVHDGVVQKMKDVFAGNGLPAYLDTTGAQLLEDARSEFRRLGLDHRSICRTGGNGDLVATWAGTIKTSTLSLKLKGMGFKTVDHDGILEVEEPSSGRSLVAVLEAIAEQEPDEVAGESLPGLENVMSEKFHRYLSPDLLFEDATSSLVDLKAVPQLARSILGNNSVG